MKLGVKEFRERFSELAHGEEPIVVTHHGRVLGRFLPERKAAPTRIEIKGWLEEMQDFQRRWREQTPDWKERLAAYGLGPDGEPLEE